MRFKGESDRRTDGGTTERSQCVQQGSWCLIREECLSSNFTVKSRINDGVSSSSPVLETSWISFFPVFFFVFFARNRKHVETLSTGGARAKVEPSTSPLPHSSNVFFFDDWIHLEFGLTAKCKKKKKKNIHQLASDVCYRHGNLLQVICLPS